MLLCAGRKSYDKEIQMFCVFNKTRGRVGRLDNSAERRWWAGGLALKGCATSVVSRRL